MKNCTNHPEKEALSFCHNCGEEFCSGCLDEGKEYYYCRKPECRKGLLRELGTEEMPGSSPELLPLSVICPACSSELELDEEERTSGIVHCPECEAATDFNSRPPKIFKSENYAELFSSLNQGDIALIKSMLENSGIRYYAYGENFLSADPLLQAVRFFVSESQLEEAKELLKDFDLRIWGASNNQ